MQIQGSNNSGQGGQPLRTDPTRPARTGVENNAPSREEIAEKIERTQARVAKAREASKANRLQDRAQAARRRFHERTANQPPANQGQISDTRTQERAHNAREVSVQNVTQQRLQAVRQRLETPQQLQLNGPHKGDQVQLSPQAQLLAAASEAGADAEISSVLLQELKEQLDQGSLTTPERVSRSAARLLGGE